MTKAPDTIGELMTADVVTVAPDATVRDALRAMIEHDIGSVVVADGDAAVGVFTERDVTRHVLTDGAVLDRRVHELMATPPITVAPSDQVIDAFDLMNAKRIRRLPGRRGRTAGGHRHRGRPAPLGRAGGQGVSQRWTTRSVCRVEGHPGRWTDVPV
jgi:CBS domain-containing protein